MHGRIDIYVLSKTYGRGVLSQMNSFLKRLFKMRIIRYGLVGGIGIPVNDLALLLFMSLMHGFYPLASACAFEVSTTINFVLNQLFTYSEQHLSGWGWVRRAGKAQLTSLSALLSPILLPWLSSNSSTSTSISPIRLVSLSPSSTISLSPRNWSSRHQPQPQQRLSLRRQPSDRA